jgi:hypothetical protein
MQEPEGLRALALDIETGSEELAFRFVDVRSRRVVDRVLAGFRDEVAPDFGCAPRRHDAMRRL